MKQVLKKKNKYELDVLKCAFTHTYFKVASSGLSLGRLIAFRKVGAALKGFLKRAEKVAPTYDNDTIIFHLFDKFHFFAVSSFKFRFCSYYTV